MGRKEFYRSGDSKDSWLVREDGSSKCSGHCTYDSDGSLLRWDNYSGYNGASHWHEWMEKQEDGSYEYGKQYSEH